MYDEQVIKVFVIGYKYGEMYTNTVVLNEAMIKALLEMTYSFLSNVFKTQGSIGNMVIYSVK